MNCNNIEVNLEHELSGQECDLIGLKSGGKC